VGCCSMAEARHGLRAASKRLPARFAQQDCIPNYSAPDAGAKAVRTVPKAQNGNTSQV
jgi:hypothetical protein